MRSEVRVGPETLQQRAANSTCEDTDKMHFRSCRGPGIWEMQAEAGEEGSFLSSEESPPYPQGVKADLGSAQAPDSEAR